MSFNENKISKKYTPVESDPMSIEVLLYSVVFFNFTTERPLMSFMLISTSDLSLQYIFKTSDVGLGYILIWSLYNDSSNSVIW